MPTPEEWSCHGTDEPVCPYCGAEQGDFWEVSGNQESDGTHECGSCSRQFSWSCVVSVDYTTHPIVGPQQLDEFFQKEDALDRPCVDTSCYCSDALSGGIPCRPGTCPNQPRVT